MRLALTDLYRARWTDRIHDEWIRNVLKQRPDLKPQDLERTRVLMNAHVTGKVSPANSTDFSWVNLCFD